MNLMPFMEQWHMLPHGGGTILCAVSGGRDSMCLLHYLHEASRQHNFTVAAAHLNHLMRDTALRDVDFVRSFCTERNIPFFTEEAPVYELAEQWNIGVEEAGRRLRYDFLYRTAQAIGAEKIATAHHMGDQAETVVLHLLRGTGPEGLGGIPPVRGRLIRPLLQTSRREIEQYLDENGIGHVEDETNEDMAYARNRLRRIIWPELERINPAVCENVARAARIIRRENDFLDELASSYLPSEGTEVMCEVLLGAPEARTEAAAVDRPVERREKGLRRRAYRGAAAPGGNRRHMGPALRGESAVQPWHAAAFRVAGSTGGNGTDGGKMLLGRLHNLRQKNNKKFFAKKGCNFPKL